MNNYLNAGDTVDNDYVENILNNIGRYIIFIQGQLNFKSGKKKNIYQKNLKKQNIFKMPFIHQ